MPNDQMPPLPELTPSPENSSQPAAGDVQQHSFPPAWQQASAQNPAEVRSWQQPATQPTGQLGFAQQPGVQDAQPYPGLADPQNQTGPQTWQPHPVLPSGQNPTGAQPFLNPQNQTSQFGWQHYPSQGTPEQPAAAQAAQWPRPAQLSPEEWARRRKRQKRGWAIVGSVVGVLALLLGGGLIARGVLNVTTYSPTAIAEEYLQAVVDGRVSDALTLYQPNVTSVERLLLNDAVYQAAVSRPSAYTVVATDMSGDEAHVRAELTMDAKTYEVTLQLRKQGTQNVFFDNWVLKQAPMGQVTLGYVAPSPKVNGVDIDLAPISTESSTALESAVAVPALPGSYTFTAPEGTEYQTFGEDQTVTILPEQTEDVDGEATGGEWADEQTDPATVDVNFLEGFTEKAAQDAISLVREHVKGCLASTQLIPAGCENTMELSSPWAITSISRKWVKEPTYVFRDGTEQEDGSYTDSAEQNQPGIEVRGGDLKTDYKQRWTESLPWQAATNRNENVFGEGTGWNRSRFVPVAVNDKGKLVIDTSEL